MMKKTLTVIVAVVMVLGFTQVSLAESLTDQEIVEINQIMFSTVYSITMTQCVLPLCMAKMRPGWAEVIMDDPNVMDQITVCGDMMMREVISLINNGKTTDEAIKIAMNNSRSGQIRLCYKEIARIVGNLYLHMENSGYPVY